MILDIGRVCRKVAGKDAGKYCAVVEKPEKNTVLVDGKDMKRKKVSITHLEPLPELLKIKKDSKTDEVIKALEKAGF